MATNVLKIDTNATGLRLAEETSIGVLPATPDWLPFQPNSYGDTGSEVETVASEPINPDRMEDKGTAVRKSVTAAFQTDYRRREQWRLLQGFCFADFIEKSGNYGQADTEDVTATVTANTFDDVGSGLNALWQVGNLCLSEGFLNSANNGLSRVTAVGVADEITVTGLTLATEMGPSGDAGGENGARLWNVGVEGVADDLEIDASGSRPILRSAGGIDWTTMGLTVGEWISIGGDTIGAGGNQFPGNATNNTQARVYSISATDLTLDATDATMVTENPGGSETIQVFWCPRILKNRTSANIVRRTYTAEQRLGVPDTAAPTLVQYARNHGLVPNEVSFQVGTADKFGVDYSFIGTQDTLVAPTASPGGNRPSIVAEDIYNTSSNFQRLKLYVYDSADANPTALFVYGQEWTFSINNNASPNEAAGVFGAFDVSVGNFVVEGSVTGYFIDFAAKNAVNNVSDAAFVTHAFQSNTQTGTTFDVPLITLGDGKVQLEKDNPATIPLSMRGSRATKISSAHDYVMMICFWAYLPARAIS
jgi:hypothetical protein